MGERREGAEPKNVLPWIIILCLEALIILFGNIITIIVFLKGRFHLRKTSVVLINLSVADFLVGLGALGDIASHICSLSSSCCKTHNTLIERCFSLGEYSSTASINFLVLISLERLYAIVLAFSQPSHIDTNIHMCCFRSLASIWNSSCLCLVK